MPATARIALARPALNSLVRDPNALISFAGTPWGSFAKSFGMLGTETNAAGATLRFQDWRPLRGADDGCDKLHAARRVQCR